MLRARLAQLETLVDRIEALLALGHKFTDEEVLELSREMDGLVMAVMREQTEAQGTNRTSHSSLPIGHCA